MKTLQPQGPARADAHGMTIALHGGARLQLEILEPALARVRLQPADGYREPRTWAIAPQAGQGAGSRIAVTFGSHGSQRSADACLNKCGWPREGRPAQIFELASQRTRWNSG